MPSYVSLFNWTDQGIRNAKDTVKRAQAARKAFEEAGCKMIDLYWTIGQYDVVVIFEAPDNDTAYKLALSTCMQGNVKTVTMPAMNEADMTKILKSM